MKRSGRPPYPDLLTPREQEVLSLLRERLSNEEIAQRLGVTLAGAKYHVSEILGKLGVSSRDNRSSPDQEESVAFGTDCRAGFWFTFTPSTNRVDVWMS